MARRTDVKMYLQMPLNYKPTSVTQITPTYYLEVLCRLWRILKSSTDSWLMSSGHHDATGAVILNGNVADFFRTTVGVGHTTRMSIISSRLFNIGLFLENIMQKISFKFGTAMQCPSDGNCFATCGSSNFRNRPTLKMTVPLPTEICHH